MSLDDFDEVPAPKSVRSNSATRRPRSAASRAIPAPVMPPPITAMSNGAVTSGLGQRADEELVELFLVHRGRGVGHEVGALLGLRERHDVAQRLGAAQEHRQAIHSEGDAAVRWGAVAEGLEQE